MYSTLPLDTVNKAEFNSRKQIAFGTRVDAHAGRRVSLTWSQEHAATGVCFSADGKQGKCGGFSE